MKVVTYYDPVLPEQEPILHFWTRSWSRHGWRTEILTPAIARLHPLWQAHQKAVSSYPTVNDPRYEKACWTRWLAYSVCAAADGAVVATDYDIINCSWNEQTLDGGRLLALHQVPTAACVGNQRAFDGFIMDALERAERGIVREGGCMHVSDMTLALKFHARWAWELHCEEYWPDALAPLVHVSAAAVRRHDTDKPTAATALLERD